MLEDAFNRVADFYEEHKPGCLFLVGCVFLAISVALFLSIRWP